ncbi:MAG: lipocalin family protein [Spirochaetales bacterium]|nr:lipocalin family protein [Spirochaetales bacterium]
MGKRNVILMMAILSLGGCASIPKGASAVQDFEKEKYLGKWYEIARFDFVFEKNLNNTTAEYTVLANGLIGVTNRGYDYVKGRWKEARGKARFRGPETIAELGVSFFGPFYTGYNVIALDKEYRYALVAGRNTDYLWILSRTPTIPENIKVAYLELVRSIGYDTDRLIWVEHNL